MVRRLTKTKSSATGTSVNLKNTSPVVSSDTNLSENTFNFYGFKIVKRCNLKLNEIQRVSNVRSLVNEQTIDPDLLESIRINGILNPLVVDKNYRLLDGHRRLYHIFQIAKPTTEVPVLILDIAPNEIPYLQYQLGLEKGLKKDEKQLAILSYAVANPELSDREIARKFAISNSTVSDITRVTRSAPAIAPYVANRNISREAALEIIEVAKKHKKDPNTIAQEIVEKLAEEKKLPESESEGSTKTINRSVTSKLLSQIVPTFQGSDKKATAVPTAKKLLRDLFLQLKPVKDLDNRQEYSAIVSNDLIEQIELCLNAKTVTTKKEFSITYTDVSVSDANYKTFWNVYLGCLTDGDENIIICTDKNWYTAEDTADFLHSVITDNNIEVDLIYEVIGGVQWLVIPANSEFLIEIAKQNDMPLLMVNLKINRHVNTSNSSEILSKFESIDKEFHESNLDLNHKQHNQHNQQFNNLSDILSDFESVDVEFDEALMYDPEDEDEDEEELTEDAF